MNLCGTRYANDTLEEGPTGGCPRPLVNLEEEASLKTATTLFSLKYIDLAPYTYDTYEKGFTQGKSLSQK